MVTRNEQFITQMKLRELREQRSHLLRMYAELQQQAQEAHSEETRLRLLYNGLQKITFAGQPLHPDVNNLHLLLRVAQNDEGEQETLTFWRKRLEQELQQGRLRAELVYVFGALLEEWTLHHAADASPAPEVEEKKRLLLALMTEPPNDPPARESFLDMLFQAALPANAQEEAERIFTDWLFKHLKTNELAAVLQKIQNAIHYSAEIRAQAQHFLHDDVLQKEFADALTIMLEHIDEWHWNEAGIPSHASPHLTKWRLFLDEDLPTLCLLEILGERWQKAFTSFFIALTHQRTNNRWISRATSSSGLRLPALSASLDPHSPHGDIWAEATRRKATLETDSSDYIENYYNSVANQRMQLKEQIDSVNIMPGYGVQPGQRSGMEIALTLLHAEIALKQAAFPETPLYVLKADLKDFFPRLPHKLILSLLEHYKLPAKHLAFFTKFLQVPLKGAERISEATCGIPNFHSLSDLLGELLMNLLEHFVQSQANVEIVRVVDDICLVATSAAEIEKAWQLLQTFCANCGLTLNADKCGSVCIGGTNPASLPTNLPSWLLIALNNEGQWLVHPERFQEYLAQARQAAQSKQSLFSQIEVYNTYSRYLVRALFMLAPLGDAHRQSIQNAMQQFQHTFFGAQRDIVDTIRAAIQQRFLDGAALTSLPEAWLYWPITAGGCGLTHSLLLAGIFGETHAQRVHPPAPVHLSPHWQHKSPAWGTFYASQITPIDQRKPVPDAIMEALVSDFIKRGAEISAGKQKDLAAYWRWILYLYGPQIREQLGTFRFLITELVPLQIILKGYRLDTDDTLADADTGDNFDPFS